MSTMQKRIVYCITMSMVTLTMFHAAVVNGFPVIERFGFRTAGMAYSSTADDVHMTLFWGHEIIQCTVQPTGIREYYWCTPDRDSSSYCWDSSAVIGDFPVGELLFTMEGTDGVFIDSVRFELSDGSQFDQSPFCVASYGGDIDITLHTTSTLCGPPNYTKGWGTLKMAGFFCVSAGDDCFYNDYVKLDGLLDPDSGNGYTKECRVTGDPTNTRTAPVLNVDYECANVCNDDVFCNGEEYFDAVDGECKLGTAVTCPLHTYCDNNAATCLRNCDSFAIDEYLSQCSTEFAANEEQINNLDIDLTDLTGRVDQHDTFETNIASLQTSLGELTSSVDDHDSSLDDINTRITSEINTVNTALDDLTASVSDMEQRSANIQTELQTINEEIETSNQKIIDFGPFNGAHQEFDDKKDLFTPSSSYFGSSQNNLIIALFMINIMVMVGGCCACATMNKQKKSRYSTVFQDTDDQTLTN